MSLALAPPYRGGDPTHAPFRAPLHLPRRPLDVLAITPACAIGYCLWWQSGRFEPGILCDQRSTDLSPAILLTTLIQRSGFRGTIYVEGPLPKQRDVWRKFASAAVRNAEEVARDLGLPLVKLHRKTVAERFGYRQAGLPQIVGAMRAGGLGSTMPDRAVQAAAFALVAGLVPLGSLA